MNKKYFITGFLVLIGIVGISAVAVKVLPLFSKDGGHDGSTFSDSIVAKANTYPPLGIMIENELMARPYEKGLSGASIVYEAPTEGGITRFLAIFDGGEYANKIGPVRSARTYFLDEILEYPDAVYAHVGGNADVLKRLTKELVRNADQFFLGQYFKRENVGKVALEHTMFTTRQWMEKMMTDKKWDTENGPTDVIKNHFTVSAKADLSGYPAASSVTVPFGSNTYKVEYMYDKNSGEFLRSQAGKPHMDTLTNTQISPKTVIVQYVTSKNNNDKEGSISIDTVGSGDALIFSMGHVVAATWEKKSLKDITTFTPKQGAKNFALPEGSVWIEVLPKPNNAAYK